MITPEQAKAIAEHVEKRLASRGERIWAWVLANRWTVITAVSVLVVLLLVLR